MKTNKSIKLAVFDIDGTIFRSSLTVELVNELIAAKIFPYRAKKQMEEEYLGWLNREGAYDDYLSRLIEIFFENIKGKSEIKVVRIAQKIINWQRKRTYRYTRDLVHHLRKKGLSLIAISGSPSFIVEEFAAAMGFDKSYGIEYEVSNGLFTGKVVNKEPIKNKQKVLKNYIKQLNQRVDLANSYAVGDSMADVSLFEAVGQPIVFNPTKELAKYAADRKWTIVVERKDSIFELDKFKLHFGLNNI